MKSLKKKISLSLYILLLTTIACDEKTEPVLNTEIRFLYEDCSNNPIKHTNSIPSNITSIFITLKKENNTVLEKKIQNDGKNSPVIIDNIEPYDRYRLDVIAFTKENQIWSGFAKNVPIKENSKTFVQINLTKEKGLTCADYLKTKRFMHSSVSLQDGRILIFGGATSIERDYDTYHIDTTDKAEIFYSYKIESAGQINTDIIAGSSTTLRSRMISGRIGYIYERLKDGKILIAGGINKADLIKNPEDFFICLNSDTSFIYDVEIFDPTTESFRVITRLKTPFAFAQSALIGNKVYIIGGINRDFNCKDSSTGGINNTLITIDVADINSPIVNESTTSDIYTFFAANKIQIAEEKYLFYGGNREDGLILSPDGKSKKIDFTISSKFDGKRPQRGYFPYAFPIKNGNLYLNVSGYDKSLNDIYFIRISSDEKISIEPDNILDELGFGGSYITYGDYLFQIGGIKSIPFTISNLFLVRKIKQDGYEKVDSNLSGVKNLKRERAFHSTELIDDNSFLITGGLYFNLAQDAIVLDLAEIYNGTDTSTK